MFTKALIGLIKSMAKMPILNICTPLPDMYSMNAFIGRDLAGAMARSQARCCFNAICDDATVTFPEDFPVDFVPF